MPEVRVPRGNSPMKIFPHPSNVFNPCDISDEYPYGTSLEMGSSRRLRADRVLTIDRPVEYSLHPNPG